MFLNHINEKKNLLFREEVTNFKMNVSKHGTIVGKKGRTLYFINCEISTDNKYSLPIEMSDLNTLHSLKKKLEDLDAEFKVDYGYGKELHRYLDRSIKKYNGLEPDQKKQIRVFDHYGWSHDIKEKKYYYAVSEIQLISPENTQIDLPKEDYEFTGSKRDDIYRCSQNDPRDIHQNVVDYLEACKNCCGKKNMPAQYSLLGWHTVSNQPRDQLAMNNVSVPCLMFTGDNNSGKTTSNLCGACLVPQLDVDGILCYPTDSELNGKATKAELRDPRWGIRIDPAADVKGFESVADSHWEGTISKNRINHRQKTEFAVLQGSCILVYRGEHDIIDMKSTSQLTKAAYCSFECDEQDIPNHQEKKSAVLAKHAEYCSIFRLFLQPIDLPTFNTNANKYGNEIQEILEEEQNSDLIDIWKKQRRLKLIYGTNISGFNQFCINAKYEEKERLKLVEELTSYFASSVIPQILKQLQRVDAKKGGKQKIQKMKSLPSKQAPNLRFLENISHWESSRDLFQNVAFVEDDNRQHTLLAIRVTTMKGISSIERKTLFEGSMTGDSRFLDEESKDDYFKGRKGALGTSSHGRCIKLPVQNVPCDIKIRFEELLSTVDETLKLDEHLKKKLDIVYGVRGEDASSDNNTQPEQLEDVSTNTTAGSITSHSSQATSEPGTSNSSASSTGAMPHEPVAKEAGIEEPNREVDEHLITNFDISRGVQGKNASSDNITHPEFLEEVLKNTMTGSIASQSSQATMKPGTSNSLASSRGNLSQMINEQVKKRPMETKTHEDEPVAKKAVTEEPNREGGSQLNDFVESHNFPWKTVNEGIYGQRSYTSVSNAEKKELEKMGSLQGKHLSHMKNLADEPKPQKSSVSEKSEADGENTTESVPNSGRVTRGSNQKLENRN